MIFLSVAYLLLTEHDVGYIALLISEQVSKPVRVND